jgi:uncharacterized phage protein gp47/JayE
MSFERPTLPALIKRIQGDVEGRLAGVDPHLRRSMSGAQARAEAGVAHGLHGHLDYLADQLHPATADEEHLYLHAGWWKIPRKDPEAAVGSVDVVGNDGSVILAGKVLQRGDGVEYSVDAEVEIAGGTALVAVTCADAGQAGNADPGVALTFVETLSGVQGKTTVDAGGLTGGADIEDLEDWRARLEARVQEPPQGGRNSDYKTWALEVAGVTRAWVFDNWLGVGTVGVFFVRDGDDEFIPDEAEVQTVFDYISEVRPAGMKGMYVLAPVAVVVDMTILLEPNTSKVRAAVTTELDDLFLREAQVEDGAGSGAMKISHINEAISLADGETDHELVGPAVNPTFSAGEIGALGVITFQSL